MEVGEEVGEWESGRVGEWESRGDRGEGGGGVSVQGWTGRI